MKMRYLFITGALILSVSFATSSPLAAAIPQFSPSRPVSQNISAAANFWRTELYFGMNKPDGSVVTEEDWNKFLSDAVTPKFPDGFTVIKGDGQYKDKSGTIVKEKSRILILLYPLKYRKSSNKKIEEIRRAYKQAFQQESVLRMDFAQPVRVSF